MAGLEGMIHGDWLTGGLLSPSDGRGDIPVAQPNDPVEFRAILLIGQFWVCIYI